MKNFIFFINIKTKKKNLFFKYMKLFFSFFSLINILYNFLEINAVNLQKSDKLIEITEKIWPKGILTKNIKISRKFVFFKKKIDKKI